MTHTTDRLTLRTATPACACLLSAQDPELTAFALPGIDVQLHTQEHTLLGGCFYVSGAIPRVTEYERGNPQHASQRVRELAAECGACSLACAVPWCEPCCVPHMCVSAGARGRVGDRHRDSRRALRGSCCQGARHRRVFGLLACRSVGVNAAARPTVCCSHGITTALSLQASSMS